MVEHRAPVPGTGWGCQVCGLGSDGAIAVFCATCRRVDARIRSAVWGPLGDTRRQPVWQLGTRHAHDVARHLGEARLASAAAE